jgi:hypothetical protein
MIGNKSYSIVKIHQQDTRELVYTRRRLSLCTRRRHTLPNFCMQIGMFNPIEGNGLKLNKLI